MNPGSTRAPKPSRWTGQHLLQVPPWIMALPISRPIVALAPPPPSISASWYQLQDTFDASAAHPWDSALLTNRSTWTLEHPRPCNQLCQELDPPTSRQTLDTGSLVPQKPTPEHSSAYQWASPSPRTPQGSAASCLSPGPSHQQLAASTQGKT